MEYNSKELYIMNGGNKLYIYKDGFGDLYNATLAEESEWSNEIIGNALRTIEVSENSIDLKFAIDNLVFHHFDKTEELLKSKLTDTSPLRQIAFATALWKIRRYEESFRIIHQLLLDELTACIDNVFQALIDFKDNDQARHFLFDCLDGENEKLSSKAHVVLTMWAFTGMPEIRNNSLLEMLKPENKYTSAYNTGIQRLKEIFKVNQ